jgi:hypothetical protein
MKAVIQGISQVPLALRLTLLACHFPSADVLNQVWRQLRQARGNPGCLNLSASQAKCKLVFEGQNPRSRSGLGPGRIEGEAKLLDMTDCR